MERVRQRNRDLKDRRLASEQEIVDYIKTIDELGKQIKQTKDLKIDKEGEKQRLNEETVTLRAQIAEQQAILESKNSGIEASKAETKAQQEKLLIAQETLENKKKEKSIGEDERKKAYTGKSAKDKIYRETYKKCEEEDKKEKDLELQVKEVKAELKKKKALLKKSNKEYAPLFAHKHDLEADLGTLKTKLVLINKEYEDMKAEVDEN